MSYGVDEIGAPSSAFVDKYLKGLTGIELGHARHNNFRLNTPIMIDIVPQPWVTHCVLPHQTAMPNVIGSDSVDFVFSSHVVEHIYDLLGALKEHFRVARRYVVHVIPHRDRTFDAGRPLTTYEELLERVGKTPPPDVPEPIGGHWTVMTTESFLEICERAGFNVIDALAQDDKVGNGFIVVLGKWVSIGEVVT